MVRMMDYGKFKYEQSVRAREARKNQARTVIKEVQFRPKIGDSDYEVKRRRVVKFLSEKDKVKCTMRFRGREVTHPELGRVILTRLIDDLGEQAVVEVMPKMEGRQITMVLAPGKISKETVSSEDSTEEDEPTAAQEELPEETAVAEPIATETETTEPAAAVEAPPEDEKSAGTAPADEE